MNKSNFWKIVIAVLILVGLLVGGWFFVKNKIKNGEIIGQDQVQTQATSDRQTYRNDEYGFEFKYPATLKITEANSGNSPFEYEVCFPTCVSAEIQILIAEKNDKNKNYINEYKSQFPYYKDYFSQVKENDVYLFWFISKKESETFASLISSFKIIPRSLVTTEWKTYTNTEYGFELKYPAYYGDFKKTEDKVWTSENKPVLSKTATLVIKVLNYNPSLVLFDNYGSELKFDAQKEQFYLSDKGYKEKVLVDGHSYTKESVGEGGDGWWGGSSSFFVFDKDKNVIIELATFANPNTYNRGVKIDEIFSNLNFSR